MGKLKNYLIELEDEGVVTWSEEFEHYYLTGNDPRLEFILSEYLKQRNELLEKAHGETKTENR